MYRLMQEMSRTEMSMGKKGLWKFAEMPVAPTTATSDLPEPGNSMPLQPDTNTGALNIKDTSTDAPKAKNTLPIELRMFVGKPLRVGPLDTYGNPTYVEQDNKKYYPPNGLVNHWHKTLFGGPGDIEVDKMMQSGYGYITSGAPNGIVEDSWRADSFGNIYNKDNNKVIGTAYRGKFVPMQNNVYTPLDSMAKLQNPERFNLPALNDGQYYWINKSYMDDGLLIIGPTGDVVTAMSPNTFKEWSAGSKSQDNATQGASKKYVPVRPRHRTKIVYVPQPNQPNSGGAGNYAPSTPGRNAEPLSEGPSSAPSTTGTGISSSSITPEEEPSASPVGGTSGENPGTTALSSVPAPAPAPAPAPVTDSSDDYSWLSDYGSAYDAHENAIEDINAYEGPVYDIEKNYVGNMGRGGFLPPGARTPILLPPQRNPLQLGVEPSLDQESPELSLDTHGSELPLTLESTEEDITDPSHYNGPWYTEAGDVISDIAALRNHKGSVYAQSPLDNPDSRPIGNVWDGQFYYPGPDRLPLYLNALPSLGTPEALSSTPELVPSSESVPEVDPSSELEWFPSEVSVEDTGAPSEAVQPVVAPAADSDSGIEGPMETPEITHTDIPVISPFEGYHPAVGEYYQQNKEGWLLDDQNKVHILGKSDGLEPMGEYDSDGNMLVYGEFDGEKIPAPLLTGRAWNGESYDYYDLLSGKVLSKEEYIVLGKERGTCDKIVTPGAPLHATVELGDDAPICRFFARARDLQGGLYAIDYYDMESNDLVGSRTVEVSDVPSVFRMQNNEIRTNAYLPISVKDATDAFDDQLRVENIRLDDATMVYRTDGEPTIVLSAGGKPIATLKQSQMSGRYVANTVFNREVPFGVENNGDGSYSMLIRSPGDGRIVRQTLAFTPFNGIPENAVPEDNRVAFAPQPGSPGYTPETKEDDSDNTGIDWDAVKYFMMLGLPIGAAIGLVMHMMGGKDSSLIANLLGGAAGGALLGGLGAGTGFLKYEKPDDANGTNVSNTATTRKI